MATSKTDDDEHRLAELGYKQELRRDWSMMHNFGVSFSIIVGSFLLSVSLCDGQMLRDERGGEGWVAGEEGRWDVKMGGWGGKNTPISYFDFRFFFLNWSA